MSWAESPSPVWAIVGLRTTLSVIFIVYLCDEKGGYMCKADTPCVVLEQCWSLGHSAMGPQINDPSDTATTHSKILGRHEGWKEPQTTSRALSAETAAPREASTQETGLSIASNIARSWPERACFWSSGKWTKPEFSGKSYLDARRQHLQLSYLQGVKLTGIVWLLFLLFCFPCSLRENDQNRIPHLGVLHWPL